MNCKPRRKNLKRDDNGNWVNQWGVVFTPDERKQLKNAVRRVNYKRDKMLRDIGDMPRMVGGVDTGDKLRSLQLMGKQNDIVMSKRTASLQRFRDKKSYNKYMRDLARAEKPDYIDYKVRHYKKNHMQALANVYGSEADDVIKKLRYMRVEKYQTLMTQEEFLEINYVYSPEAAAAKLNKIKSALGISLDG